MYVLSILCFSHHRRLKERKHAGSAITNGVMQTCKTESSWENSTLIILLYCLHIAMFTVLGGFIFFSSLYCSFSVTVVKLALSCSYFTLLLLRTTLLRRYTHRIVVYNCNFRFRFRFQSCDAKIYENTTSLALISSAINIIVTVSDH